MYVYMTLYLICHNIRHNNSITMILNVDVFDNIIQRHQRPKVVCSFLLLLLCTYMSCNYYASCP